MIPEFKIGDFVQFTSDGGLTWEHYARIEDNQYIQWLRKRWRKGASAYFYYPFRLIRDGFVVECQECKSH